MSIHSSSPIFRAGSIISAHDLDKLSNEIQLTNNKMDAMLILLLKNNIIKDDKEFFDILDSLDTYNNLKKE